MLGENLMMLRKMNGYTQGQVAEKLGISRQAYAKWESGASVPDIGRANELARIYGISLDKLMCGDEGEDVGLMPPAPPGKNIWGTVTLGARGQIVIPKAARDRFGFKGGETLMVVSDEIGIALLPVEFFENMIRESMGSGN
ncbi:MAG: helix-turn-helix domain-containing protein [Candidatus Methanomethylophilaceae archaeon]|nr:helix-turn-helix domain-containing protein [Candidatus Methanomethylophilaceae archaeon]MBP5394747.1 helix-turn-helix domain-containing protein [Candidatus Methanomethylophilaceae archaeon]